ncbi:hypothetical protein LGN19_05435 [Burkholderia sp. AU30198]|nr:MULTISPECIES: hypothetical protein [Burkholderia]MCA8293232.1 hypothetical protein [Burkholderia sp. AU30198]
MSLTLHGTFRVAAVPFDREFDVQCDTRDGWPTTSDVACDGQFHRH